MSIPKLLHFIRIGDAPLPDWAKRHVAEFTRLNPDHTVRVHGAESLIPDYGAAWDACADLTQRSDLLRYSVLEQHGGWYFDMDFWPFRPLADAESAWGLDGSRLVVARQHGQRNQALTLANAPLACAPGLPLWQDVRAEVQRRTPPARRVAYGPEIVLWLSQHRPADLVAMDWPWWFPSSIADAPGDYDAIHRDPSWARVMCRETGGQSPYAMHLWAGGREALPPGRANGPKVALILPMWTRIGEAGVEFARLRAPSEAWPLGSPLAVAREGLQAAGYDVRCIAPSQVGRRPRYCGAGLPVVAVIWNGRRPPAVSVLADLRSDGVPCFQLEHGFWDRRRFVQCDHAGFLHFASWADDWDRTPPDGAAERLAATAPIERRPMRARQTGPVLVVGQLAGDTQVAGAAINGPAMLDRVVSRAMPRGKAALFRPHPKDIKRDARAVSLKRTYLDRVTGVQDLVEALDGARFVITINSNTLVEAALRGCPALAFGPSTAISAGVARPCTAATLRDDIEAMLGGWMPKQSAVDRYLQWLACRQYEVNELRQAEFWHARIGHARPA